MFIALDGWTDVISISLSPPLLLPLSLPPFSPSLLVCVPLQLNVPYVPLWESLLHPHLTLGHIR
jgi:hypothetical protein